MSLRFSRSPIVPATVALIMALAAVACVSALPRTYPAAGVLVDKPGADGWLAIHEPGWFDVAMPGVPRTGEDQMAASTGSFRIKTLEAWGGTARYLVYYAAPANLPAAKDLASEGRASLGDTRGSTLIGEKDVTLAGVPAVEVELESGADSELNGTHTMVKSVVRIAVDGPRFLQLAYSASAADFNRANADHFFDSLSLASHAK